jgi:CRP/FNR family transcriptional regulator, cyclic AMP receptor protein
MYGLFEIPQEAIEFLARARPFLPQVLARVTRLEQGKLLSATRDLYANHDRVGKVYVLTEGVLTFSVAEANLFNYEHGDLVGLEHACGLVQGKYSSEFAVRADEYRMSDIFSAAGSSELALPWTQYLVNRLNAERLIIAALTRGEREFQPTVRAYKAGEQIVEQGAMAQHVFTLIEGAAEAYVNGVKVGDVLQDEIFGALATLTKTPRTATVIATTNCLVLSLDGEKFLALIKNRPATVLTMVQGMARTIMALNKQVVELFAFKAGS